MRSKLSEAQKILVSFSGGADSLALLLFAWQNFPEKTEAVHFEHGLRGKESLRDAAFCRAFCEVRNIPFSLVPLDVPRNRINGEGDEEAARRLRLEAWKRLVTDPEHTVVLLGHHGDDAVENLLLRLFRGSNASGLASLQKERILNGICFLRPQLDMTRAGIETYLAENGIREWCQDSTNDDPVYLRNYLRNVFLPELAKHAPHATGGMKRSLQSLADDADLLEQLADTAYERCKDGSLDEWKILHPALLVRVLRRFLGGIIPTRQAVERLQQELQKPYFHPVRIDLGMGIMLKRTKNTLLILQETDRAEIIWDWKKEPDCCGLHAEILPRDQVQKLTGGAAFFDADLMPETLILAPWQEGSRILAFDGRNKSLKKLFCNHHKSGNDRLVLRGADGTVYLAPGVCHSAVAKVTDETKSVLHISGEVTL